jgi:hypothetical protein
MMGKFLPVEKAELEIQPPRHVNVISPNIEPGIHPRVW